MNGPHDVGGKHGFGPIDPDPDEPLFRHAWEKRVFGIAYCILTSGCHTIDASRHAAERMPHAHYLGSSYYEHWLFAYQLTMDERGLCTRDEVDRRMAEQAEEPQAAGSAPQAAGSAPQEPSELARRMLRVLEEGRRHDVPRDTAPSFRTGQRVRARNLHTKRHLRLPGYAKGRKGVVDAYYGHFEHPEARAHDEPDPGAHLYRIAFEAAELWGPDAERGDDIVCLDLIEDYLEAVA
jgi:nitrile hydratase beta subunit